MKLSRFNILMEDYPAKGHHFCFNTLSKATVVLNQELLDYIKTLKGINEVEKVKEEAKDLVKQLLDMNILCPDERNEIDYLYYWLNSQRFNTKNMLMTVLTTYRCNLACPYCYEKGIDETPDMDEKLQKDTCDWILDKLEQFGSKSLSMTFLGGEPFLNTKPIDYLSEQLYHILKEKGIDFKFHLVSNGVLMKPEKVKPWLERGLTSIQVTIDGIKEIHDTMRPFSSGAGSFDIIINNLVTTLKACPELRVPIRINCNKENYKRVPEFLDFIDNLNINKKQIAISYGHLVPFFGADEDETQNLLNESENGMIEVYLAKETKKRGFKLQERTFSGPCMTIKKAAFLIDPVGDIYNCWSFVRRPGFKLGSIYEENLSDFYAEMIGYDVIKDCLDCKYVPICLGGCRNNAFIYHGDAKARHCRSFFLHGYGEELLRLYFAPDYIQEIAAKEGYDL